MAFAKRIDVNQPEIVAFFRQLGFSVLVMSQLGKGAPDIACGFDGVTYFFEIKDGNKPPSKRKLTPDELEFMTGWKGHYQVIDCIEDVVNFHKRITIKKNSEILARKKPLA